MKETYYQDKKGKTLFSAKGIDCKCILNDGDGILPSFEVVGYTNPDNVIFKYEKGDIITPSVLNEEYALLLLDVEGEEADEWKLTYINSVVIYKKICNFDRMSYTTLKEVREALDKELAGIKE